MILQLRGVRYQYAGAKRAVLDGIDLDVAAGQVVGVVGPNDAGKSTLCLVAAGLAPASIGGRLDGSARLGGAETRDLRPHEAAQRCAVMLQRPELQLSGTAETVYEEIAFGPRNLGLDLRAILQRVDWAMAALGIEALAARDPEHLSGGQAQLVALASVLALRPPLLVLDEPTGQLDPAGTRLVSDALAGLASATGTGILVVEQRTGLLARLADEVVLLEEGRIVARGPSPTILESPELERRGVEPPPEVRIRRAVEAAGLGHRLDGLDLGAVELGSEPGDAATITAAEPFPGDREAARWDGVDFAYPDGTPALAGIDLGLQEGETAAIVGQNGSGKSTLVRHLNGLLRPDRGRVVVGGRDIAGRHVAELARAVGIAFQDPDRQIFAGRVRAEVEFGPRSLGRSPRDLAEAVRGALAAAGLDDLAEANPYDLGYARRKLLGIASILALQAPIVVLDEPTTGQDARGLDRLQRLVAALAADGRTVITISHQVRFVAETAERVVVMAAGRVVADAAPDLTFSAPAWPTLRATGLEPPLAAWIGARLGLGATPTEAALVAALERSRGLTGA
jgi:energy-coupling factor transport system ATP-binding protein